MRVSWVLFEGSDQGDIKMFPDFGGSLEEDPEFQLGSSRQNSFFCSCMTEVSAVLQAAIQRLTALVFYRRLPGAGCVTPIHRSSHTTNLSDKICTFFFSYKYLKKFCLRLEYPFLSLFLTKLGWNHCIFFLVQISGSIYQSKKSGCVRGPVHRGHTPRI